MCWDCDCNHCHRKRLQSTIRDCVQLGWQLGLFACRSTKEQVPGCTREHTGSEVCYQRVHNSAQRMLSPTCALHFENSARCLDGRQQRVAPGAHLLQLCRHCLRRVDIGRQGRFCVRLTLAHGHPGTGWPEMASADPQSPNRCPAQGANVHERCAKKGEALGTRARVPP